MTFYIWEYFKPTLEIIIFWIIIYRILVFFEGTRAFQVLKGLSYLLIAFLIAQILGFDTLNWLLTKFFAISIIAFLIIFQQELRQGLARLGQHHMFSLGLEESELIEMIEEITSSVFKMSRQKTGALMAIERENKLRTIIESGVKIDGLVTSELIQSIFMTTSPLHDGGIVLCGNRVMAASCLFPLSDNPNFSKIIGTRHRAAIGISEQTDAIAIIVSEETGEISVASDGKFIPIVNRERLVSLIKDLLVTEEGTAKDEKTVNA